MATSRVARYLGSTKNLAGCALGLVGVVLHLTGLVGALWLPVVVALYLAGALAAPPERVHLTVDPRAEASRLRTDLITLTGKVRSSGGRLPATALPTLDRLAGILGSVLDHPEDLAASPDTTHEVTRLIRLDVPLAFETYLNLPWWFAATTRAGGATPTDELTTQLALLQRDATRIATEFFADTARRQTDHGRYLRDRTTPEEPTAQP